MHTAAQIIANARKTGAYYAFHRQEIPFVCRHPGLNCTDKVLWLSIAAQTSMDKDLCMQRSQADLADGIAKTRRTVLRSITRLNTMGFLRSGYRYYQTSQYHTTLPADGMTALADDTLHKGLESKTPTLRDYRQHGFFTQLGREELSFVLANPALSDLQKVLWVFLANESAKSPQLAIRYAYRTLGALLGKTKNTIYQAIGALVTHGFLKMEEDPLWGKHLYTLALPQAGLAKLMQAKARTLPKEDDRTVSTALFFVDGSQNLTSASSDLSKSASELSKTTSDSTQVLIPNTANTKTISINTCDTVNELKLIDGQNAESAPVAALSAAACAINQARLQTSVGQLLKNLSLGAIRSTTTTIPSPQEEALEKDKIPIGDTAATDIADPIPPVSTFEPICPEREPWAFPVENPLHIPGEAHIPLPVDAMLYWKKQWLNAGDNPSARFSEEERILMARAFVHGSLDPNPFPQGSDYADYRGEQWAQAIGDLHAALSLPVPLNPTDTRYWRDCFQQRSRMMGFGGQLNFYVFNAFDPLPQMFIRAAMRSPEPPPSPKAAPSLGPHYKSAHGEYPIAHTLEVRLKQEIPQFILDGEFDEKVAKRGADALKAEILFYVASKATAFEQTGACNAAYVMCRQGKWSTPLGMLKKIQK